MIKFILLVFLLCMTSLSSCITTYKNSTVVQYRGQLEVVNDSTSISILNDIKD